MSENTGSSMSLYRITSELAELKSIAQEFELTEEQEQQLAISQANFVSKSGGYCYIMDQCELLVAGAKLEIQRLKEFIKFQERAEERLRGILLSAVLELVEPDSKGIKRITTPNNHRLSTRRNPRPIYENESRIPQEYYIADVTVKRLSVEEAQLLVDKLAEVGYRGDFTPYLDKTRVNEELKSGVEIPGASWDPEGYSLTIK